MKPLLVLIFGPNGAGKTTIARALATKYGGLHIQIDTFSGMARGKFWYTRQNNKDKMALMLGVLDVAIKKTNYKKFFLDGVLIHRFAFNLLEAWCCSHGVLFIPVLLEGKLKVLNYRVRHRKSPMKPWNRRLLKFYKNFRVPRVERIDSSAHGPNAVVQRISTIMKQGGGR